MGNTKAISTSRAEMLSILKDLEEGLGKGVSGMMVYWEDEQGLHCNTAGEMSLHKLVGAQLTGAAACFEALFELQED